jgi:hypothetical protein
LSRSPLQIALPFFFYQQMKLTEFDRSAPSTLGQLGGQGVATEPGQSAVNGQQHPPLSAPLPGLASSEERRVYTYDLHICGGLRGRRSEHCACGRYVIDLCRSAPVNVPIRSEFEVRVIYPEQARPQRQKARERAETYLARFLLAQ